MRQKEKNEEIFCKRMKELAIKSFQKNIIVYSDFLNLYEQDLFYKIEKDLPMVKTVLYGGYEEAERRVICFYVDGSFQDIIHPVSCIQITPTHPKFQNALTHRDYLGSILSLGIDRSKIGDIQVTPNAGYVYCNQMIASFICENLNRVKQTCIYCKLVQLSKSHVSCEWEEITGTVSSIRLDSVIAIALQSSRNSITELITKGMVFINNRLVQSVSSPIKENDKLSIRGHGRYIYIGIKHKTKKGRYLIIVQKYK